MAAVAGILEGIHCIRCEKPLASTVYKLSCGHRIDEACKPFFESRESAPCPSCKQQAGQLSFDAKAVLALQLLRSAQALLAGEEAHARGPISTTISDEAQGFLKGCPLISWTATTLAEWEALQKGAVDFGKPESDKAREKYLDKVEEISIANVPVVKCTPRGFDPGNEKKAILFFHGGAYVMNDARDYHMVSGPIADASGIQLYSVNYSLAPQHPFPAALEDAYAVYQAALKEKGAENVVLYGDSAGGGLALAVLQRVLKDGGKMPAGVALVSPWIDLGDRSDTLLTSADLDPIVGNERSLEAPRRAYAGGQDLKNPLISPIFGTYNSSFPPMHIVTGTRDPLLSDACRLQSRLLESQVKVSLRVFEGMWHDFTYVCAMPESKTANREIGRFIKAQLISK